MPRLLFANDAEKRNDRADPTGNRARSVEDVLIDRFRLDH
jgi:hypothetical protein